MEWWMSGEFFYHWGILAISLCNTILLLWLGLTVLLNAEHRTWAVWMAGGGLLMGAAFFISHSAILARGLKSVSDGMSFWWQLGWIPVVGSPLAWYLVMLWYAGFWEDTQSSLHRRQRLWFLLTLVLATVLVGLLLFANPFPQYRQIAQLDLSYTPMFAGMPLLVPVYSLYILLCISLSLDSLLRPQPSGRVMGDLARTRARPWLVSVSFILLLVSVLVATIMAWVVINAADQPIDNLASGLALPIATFDLVIATLIGVAIVMLGQAVVSYEIFTGKALPRRGLLRQWRSVTILAVGYGVVVGLSLALQLYPIYSVLPATTLMALFFALFSWRSYVERERYIEHLSPFVTSQRLHEHLLERSPNEPPYMDAASPFRALCEDVLGVERAYLIPTGPLAPLAGAGLTYPISSTTSITNLPIGELSTQFKIPELVCVSVDPNLYGGATWAVPLWSERGLIGLFLLGEKRDGGLYTQEEIAIVRASGERLIDTQATAELAKRLMTLQRQRLSESQILDRRARRVLHDDVLPRLHTAMLSLSTRPEQDGIHATQEAVDMLADAHRQISNLLHEMPAGAAPEVARLGLIGALENAVDDELGTAFDGVTWQIEPEAARHISAIPPLTAEVLYYAARECIRNAARYGRNGDSSRPLHLKIGMASRNGLELQIEDDGMGLGAPILANTSENGSPNYSSPNTDVIGGSGHGLALHSTMMAVVGGSMSVQSVPGKYTRITLNFPHENPLTGTAPGP